MPAGSRPVLVAADLKQVQIWVSGYLVEQKYCIAKRIVQRGFIYRAVRPSHGIVNYKLHDSSLACICAVLFCLLRATPV